MKCCPRLLIGTQIRLDSCHTSDMDTPPLEPGSLSAIARGGKGRIEQRQTQRELFDDLISRGTLTKEQVNEIRTAPIWNVPVRELLGYLAGLIIAAGVIQIISVVFEDASKWAVVAALYAAAGVLGSLAWFLNRGQQWRQRLAEVFELAALGCLAGATGVVLDDADMRGEWIVLTLSSGGVIWGFIRASLSRFAGTLVLTASLPAFATALAAVIREDSTWLPGAFMVPAGVILLVMGNRDIGVDFIARAVGALYVLIGTMILGNGLDHPAYVIPLVVGAVMFGAGTIVLAPELLLSGAFLVVAGVVITTNELISSEMARGLVIVATGLAMLAVLSVQMKRAVSRPETGTPTASVGS